ncbi:hypothetical protein PMAYCL1PPCAC_26039, partial [Pristionchus mayeri]
WIFPIIPSILIHVIYYHKAFRRGEKRFAEHFFFYQVAVTSIQWILFLTNGDVSRFIVIPLFVLLASCIALYHCSRQIIVGNNYSGTGVLPTTLDASNLNNAKRNMPSEIPAFAIMPKG